MRAAPDHLLQRPALRLRAEVRDQPRAEHRGVEERLDDARAPQLLEHRRDVEARAAEAADLLRQERADHAELGQLAPDACVEALLGGDDGA